VWSTPPEPNSSPYEEYKGTQLRIVELSIDSQVLLREKKSVKRMVESQLD